MVGISPSMAPYNECAMRLLALNFSTHLLPWSSSQEVFDALDIRGTCGGAAPPRPAEPSATPIHRPPAAGDCIIHVAPTGSDSSDSGSAAAPFASLARAQAAVRATAAACTVLVQPGSRK